MQTCIAAKRFIVLDEIYDAFLSLYTQKMKAAKMGEPTDETSYYGPMARVDLRDELHEQVLKTVAQGGKLSLRIYSRSKWCLLSSHYPC
jgi:succinate-semialdehyde dehydrogenase/glutarate-semialdehyde dehydrogenase